MYTMIIVDDETIVREGLLNFIDWHSIDVDVIATADDGLAALALIEHDNPDIILSDISMPNLNGIEMIESLRQQNITSQVVFISAYSNFEYAQKAVKFGAFDYILKPINEQEVIDTVRKCCEKIQGDHKIQQNVNKDAQSLIQSVFTSWMCYNISPTEEEASQLEEFYKQGFKSVIASAFLYGNIQPDIILISEQVRQIGNTKTIVLDTGSQEKIMVLFCENDDLIELEHNFYQCLIDLKAQHNTNQNTLQISMSRAYPARQNPHRLYCEVMFTFIFPSIGMDNEILCFSDYKCEHVIDNEQPDPADLLGAIRSLNLENVVNEFNILFFKFARGEALYDIDSLKIHCISLVDYVLQNLQELQVKLSISSKSGGVSSKKNIYHEKSIDRVYDVSRNILCNITSHLQVLSEKPSSRHILLVLEYIQKNYNKDISLNEVASQLYVTPKYLSRIFSSEMGEGFSRYLTRFRIDMAKKLLCDPRYKIYEVAEMVGFTDIAYFSKTFKQLCGVLPTKYKNMDFNKK